MEYSIIANCTDGRQLTGSGYTTAAQAERAVNERVRFHNLGTSTLDAIIVVCSNGAVLRFDPATGIVIPPLHGKKARGFVPA